jgi:hypothetical protein
MSNVARVPVRALAIRQHLVDYRHEVVLPPFRPQGCPTQPVSQSVTQIVIDTAAGTYSQIMQNLFHGSEAGRPLSATRLGRP